MTTQSITTDLLVIGSGAGALTAAIVAALHGLKVMVIEKDKCYGGTSAMSGGGIWIPNSDSAKQMGIEDSFDEAYTYMKSVIGDEVDDKQLRTFIEQAPTMMSYLQKNTHLNYQAFPYPDYYSSQPGAKKGYRTQAPAVFKGSKLGSDLYNINPQNLGSLVLGRFSLTIGEARMFLTKEKGWKLTLFKVLMAYLLDIPGRMKGKLARRMTQGHALIASLFLSLKENNVPVWLDAHTKELINSDNKVTGAVVDYQNQCHQITATKGVVLATGGFDQNDHLRKSYLPKPTKKQWSAAHSANTGDALALTEPLKPALALMQCAWWIPVVEVPGREKPQAIFAERSLPGLVIVNSEGRRFANEALPYLESGLSMYQCQSIPSWVVFDADFRYKYPFGPLTPGWSTPDKQLSGKVKSITIKADSLEALSEKMGIDCNGLIETIKRNNHFAETGIDEDFQRGDSYYDRYYGDRSNTPNPCIAPIIKAPFYALPLYPGDIGTKGGLLTNHHAQVLNEDKQIIQGLYAIGNCSASVMGTKYVGAGATLGPAMTFGYLAALHAAQSN